MCSASEDHLIVLYYTVLYLLHHKERKIPVPHFHLVQEIQFFPSPQCFVVCCTAETTVVEYCSSISVIFFIESAQKLFFKCFQKQ